MGGSGQVLSKTAVLDYLYGRLEGLRGTILRGEGPARWAAKEERAFLERQLGIVYGGGRWRSNLDPAVARAVREGGPRAPSEVRPEPPGDEPIDAKALAAAALAAHASKRKRSRPAYLEECEKMDFGALRRYIDDSLQVLSESDPGEGPRSKEQFLVLLEMLRGKIPELGLPEVLPSPGPPPKFPVFEPSDHLSSLREEQGRLAAALKSAEANPEATERSISKLKHRLVIAVRERSALEDKERQEHAERRDAYLRPYRKADQAYAASVRRRDEVANVAGKRMARRAEITERIRRDIDGAFTLGARPRTRRLPWRLLPPGELSVEGLRRHYEGVQRRNPEVRFEPERLEKALSLGPEQCYVGAGEFDGYVVFAYPGTERVLLECPVYGNAIYVLGRDWKRLSKMSKGQLLSGRHADVTKIVHRGDWFWRVELALGIG